MSGFSARRFIKIIPYKMLLKNKAEIKSDATRRYMPTRNVREDERSMSFLVAARITTESM